MMIKITHNFSPFSNLIFIFLEVAQNPKMGLLSRRLRKAGHFNKRRTKMATRPAHALKVSTARRASPQEQFIGKSVAKAAEKHMKGAKSGSKGSGKSTGGKGLYKKGLPGPSNRDFARKIKISPTGNSDRSIQQAAMMGGDNVSDSIVGEFQAMHGGAAPTPHKIKAGNIGRVVKPPKSSTPGVKTTRKPRKSAQSAGETMLERFKKAKETVE